MKNFVSRNEFLSSIELAKEGKVAFYCVNEEEFSKLLELLKGYGFSSKAEYLYKPCVFIRHTSNFITYDTLTYATNSGVKIIQFNNLEKELSTKKPFSLQKLESGMEIILRDNSRCSFLKKIGAFYNISDKQMLGELDSFNENLLNIYSPSKDIMEIYTEKGELIWERLTGKKREVRLLERRIEELKQELELKKKELAEEEDN